MTTIEGFIETETRTETDREVTVEEHTETYEVADCAWCNDEYRTDELVPIAVGVTPTEQKLEDIPVSNALNEWGQSIETTADVTVSGWDPTLMVAYCPFCTESVFGIDADELPTLADYRAREATESLLEATDGADSASRTDPFSGLPNPPSWGWDRWDTLFWAGALLYLVGALGYVAGASLGYSALLVGFIMMVFAGLSAS